MSELLLASRECNQCLFGPNRIVSAARAKEVIAECLSEDKHFVCHKGSIAGLNLHCRGFYNRHKCAAVRVGQALNVPVREIDPEKLK